MSFRCTASIAGSADILRKALASASGFFVISADPASAIYSRLREMAKRIRLAKRKPIAAISKYEDENSSATFTIATYTYMCNRIEGDFRQHGEDADKHDRDYQQTYIPIADMSKLMPDYCFQFLVIQLLDDAS